MPVENNTETSIQPSIFHPRLIQLRLAARRRFQPPHHHAALILELVLEKNAKVCYV